MAWARSTMAVAAAVLLTSAVTAAAPDDAPPGLAGAPDLQQGQAIVVGAHTREVGGGCFQCHGMDGSGDAAGGVPRLTDQVYKYLYDSLRDYASGARDNQIMGPIAAKLTPEQMRDVAFYYASLEQAPYGPVASQDGELLQTGAVIAAVGAPEQGVQGCINCHGPKGVGLPPTYPYLAGQHASYLEAQLRAWRSGARSGDGFGIMEEIAKAMTEEQIRAVSLYYASLRPDSVTPEQGATGAEMVAVGNKATSRPEER